MSPNNPNYTSRKSQLLSFPHTFLSLPTSPAPLHISQTSSTTTTTSTIASLSLHPALESALHLLNNDLPSAHFLVRHAQSAPAWECMYLHGILHRIEGDVVNARCWYGDVEDSEVLKHVWEGNGDWGVFLDRVERWRDRMAGRRKRQENGAEGVDWEREEKELEEKSLWEMKQVLDYLEGKFGVGKVDVADAVKVWVQPDKEHQEKGNQMIVGGEGWREF